MIQIAYLAALGVLLAFTAWCCVDTVRVMRQDSQRAIQRRREQYEEYVRELDRRSA